MKPTKMSQNSSQKIPWKLKVIALGGMGLIMEWRKNILELYKTYHSTVRIHKMLWNVQRKVLCMEEDQYKSG